VSAEVRRELVKRGHEVADRVGLFGGYQAVARDPVSGVLSGATESRKDGCAMGY
jgi:gamma-glutamyltranspeptidase/glutathione hydrolase